jgi:hypothetical protein
MENPIALTIGTFILLSLLISGAYFIQPQDTNKTYVCNATQLMSICDKLGASDTRCYFNVSHYKTCLSKWVKYTVPPTPLCYSDNIYTYCCELSKLANKGSCDFIVRRKT